MQTYFFCLELYSTREALAQALHRNEVMSQNFRKVTHDLESRLHVAERHSLKAHIALKVEKHKVQHSNCIICPL